MDSGPKWTREREKQFVKTCEWYQLPVPSDVPVQEIVEGLFWLRCPECGQGAIAVVDLNPTKSRYIVAVHVKRAGLLSINLERLKKNE